MSSDGLRSLSGQLRAAPPAAVGELEDEHLTHLAAAIRAARRRQAEQLEAASEQALKRLPKVLRGPVRKVVG